MLGTDLTLFQSLVKKYVCKDYSMSLSYAYNIIEKKLKMASHYYLNLN